MAQTARKFRLYPTPAQAQTLRAWEGSARFVYNAKLEEDRYRFWLKRRAILSPSWRQSDPMLSKEGGIDQKTAHLKGEQTAFLSHVPAVVLRNAASQYRQAWSNRWKNPAHFGSPTPRRKYASGVLLTRELFHFTGDGRLWIGSKKRPVGHVRFKAHRSWQRPNQIVVREDRDGSWWVSFSYVVPDHTPKALTAQSTVIGVDRGVTVPLALSSGEHMDMPAPQRKSLTNRQRRIKGLQQRLARQRKGSKRRAQTKRKLARCNRAVRCSREDFAHKASRALVNSGATVISFEKLLLGNMTKSAKGTVDNPGSNVRQKAGLNRAILDRALGMVCRFTEYKAAHAGLTVRYVPAAYSSQECAVCGHTSPLNRPSQAVFHCQRCGHSANADTNAAEVVAARTKRWLKEEFTGRETGPPLGTHGVTDAIPRPVSA
jgi:putative transposase